MWIAHDFFTPQPVENAAVFLLKQILHDWPDAYASRILVRLRDVARKDTKLVLIENLIPLACHDHGSDDGEGIPGAVPKEAPKPLLANYGIANEMAYNGDMAVRDSLCSWVFARYIYTYVYMLTMCWSYRCLYLTPHKKEPSNIWSNCCGGLAGA